MQATANTPRQIVLHPANDVDPRGWLDEQALVEANRNAFPVVTQRRGARDGMGVGVAVAVAMLLGGATFWTMSANRQDLKRVAQQAKPVASAPAQVAAQPQPIVLPPEAITPAPAPVAAPAAPAPQPVLAAPPGTIADARAERLRSPTMVFDASALPAGVVAGAVAAGGTAVPPAGPAGSLGENEDFASRIGGGSSGAAATAVAMSNPGTTVTQGTLIPAILETAIDTDLPGYVRAVVSQDVRSFDGSRVLVPRSSRLIGQYKSGLAAGQTRAYVIWTRLIRPDGASVALGSPAVEFSGRSGLTGQVDGHFFKRFGSAMLLSVVGGLGALTSGGASLIVGGGQSAASVAAGRDANIAPTIRVRQGEPIRVFTARDLDFSQVAK